MRVILIQALEVYYAFVFYKGIVNTELANTELPYLGEIEGLGSSEPQVRTFSHNM